MTLHNVERLYKHFSKIASGNFEESDFNYKIGKKRKGEEAGAIVQGEMSKERKDLIIGDAKRHIETLEKQFPSLSIKKDGKGKTQ